MWTGGWKLLKLLLSLLFTRILSHIPAQSYVLHLASLWYLFSSAGYNWLQQSIIYLGIQELIFLFFSTLISLFSSKSVTVSLPLWQEEVIICNSCLSAFLSLSTLKKLCSCQLYVASNSLISINNHNQKLQPFFTVSRALQYCQLK